MDPCVSQLFFLEERPKNEVNNTPKRHGITILFLLIFFANNFAISVLVQPIQSEGPQVSKVLVNN